MPPVAVVPKVPDAATRSDAQFLYVDDFWSWARQQSAALRERRFDDVDWPNLLEEVEDMAGRHQESWQSLCENIIEHLLRIQYCTWADSVREWSREIKEIKEWRRQAHKLLRRYPGMQSIVGKMFVEAWESAREDAVRNLAEYDAPAAGANRKAACRKWNRSIPEECPYGIADTIGFEVDDLKRVEMFDERWPPGVARVLVKASVLEHAGE